MEAHRRYAAAVWQVAEERGPPFYWVRGEDSQGNGMEVRRHVRGGISMIEWKKYNPDNPPEFDIGKEYLIREVDRGQKLHQVMFYAPFYKQWQYVFQNFGPDWNEVTHYAEINLPEE